jgi:ornithine decarboxylase
MGYQAAFATDLAGFLRTTRPTTPVLFFCPETLAKSAHTFVSGFPGQVTYAVKANPTAAVIETLNNAGVTAFDVASIAEVELVRKLAPQAELHFNNPVRSNGEIRQAVALGVASFSVDSISEAEKLAAWTIPENTEVSVRFKLPVEGAAYDFGSKFGAEPDYAVQICQFVKNLGFKVSLTFHPGTQCEDPVAWATYIQTAADISVEAGLTLHRLNVGGGFPSHRNTHAPDLLKFFDTIKVTAERAFADQLPPLLCEPGRALVSEAFTLAAQVRAVRDEADVFLNDGIYGGLSELAVLPPSTRISHVSTQKCAKSGELRPTRIFGPTCDSRDELPGPLMMPVEIAEEDYLLFAGFGAYCETNATTFNGFGDIVTVNCISLAKSSCG